MATMQVSSSAVALGRTFSFSTTITTDMAMVADPPLAAAKVGALTTRTSGTVGTLTMAAGHGITTGAILDVYWTGGSCSVTVGTVATNSVPFTAGVGDALPDDETAITAMVQHVEAISFDDGGLKALVVGADQAACTVTLYDDADAAVGAIRVASGTTTTVHYIWHYLLGSDVPASDAVASVGISHGDSANTRTVTVLAMVN